MNTKRLLMTAAFILVVGLGASATAQRKTSLQDFIIPPQPIETSVTMELNSVEVTDGSVALDPKRGDTMFGYGFLGRTSGDLPGSFMFSMNCFPSFFAPGESNEITGGMWTLPVYMRPFKGLNTTYMGSLFGTLVKGSMDWDKTVDCSTSGLCTGSALVYFELNVTGGTQNWAGATGYGTFKGTLTQNEKTGTTLNGWLTISYVSNPLN